MGRPYQGITVCGHQGKSFDIYRTKFFEQHLIDGYAFIWYKTDRLHWPLWEMYSQLNILEQCEERQLDWHNHKNQLIPQLVCILLRKFYLTIAWRD